MALHRFPSQTSNQQDEVVKAVFFDRDGVLNELVDRGDGIKTAPWNTSEFKILPNAKEAVDIVKKLGYKSYVVTNQPDMYDGHMSKESLDLMMKMIQHWLKIDSYFCAFDRSSKLYKPNSGMVEYFINLYSVSRKKSFMIGDHWKDIVCGYNSKLTTIFIGTEYSCPEEYKYIKPDHVVNNVLEACELIKELEKNDN